MILISQLTKILEGVIPALGLGLAVYVGIWFKRVQAQSKRNKVNEIDLSLKKITVDTHSKPLDELVSQSNSRHGANGLVKDPGDGNKKGK